MTTAITVTYSAVCATDSARLIEVEYCTTATLTIEEEQECACATASAAADSAAAEPVAAVAVATTTPPATAAAAAEASAASAAVPMCTVTETCDACGENGESTVTLTIPLAVVTGGEDVTVTAIEAVQTVVPVLATNPAEEKSPSSNVTGGGGGGGVDLLPVKAGAGVAAEMGFGRLGWGLTTTAWLGLLGLFLML